MGIEIRGDDMRIEIEIPEEFEKDYTKDKFKDFFSRVLLDIDQKGACGLYEEEIAEMMIEAFDKSKPAYDINKVVEKVRELNNKIEVQLQKQRNL